METDEVELNYTLNLVKLTETMSHYFAEFNQLVIYSFFTRFSFIIVYFFQSLQKSITTLMLIIGLKLDFICAAFHETTVDLYKYFHVYCRWY